MTFRGCVRGIWPGVVTGGMWFFLAASPVIAEKPGAGTQGTDAVSAKGPEKKDATGLGETPGLPPTKHAPKFAGRTQAITVRGKAVNDAGDPVAGAKIYIVGRTPDYGHVRVAETTTNAKGLYVLQEVQLPISGPPPNQPGHEGGAFAIFGQAAGFGFSWRGERTFLPNARPEEFNATSDKQGDGPGGFHDPRMYFRNNPISLNLMFSKPAKVRGRIVDDQGAPIRGVRLDLRFCQRLDFKTLREGTFSGGDFVALNDRNIAPDEMKIRQTDADGRFEYADVPPRCVFRFDVTHPDFARQSLYAATANGPFPKLGKATIHSGDMMLTFSRVQSIPVQVLYADTRQPAPKVYVGAETADHSVHTSQSTDEQGRATLRLPPGEYICYLLPQFKTPYLPTDLTEKWIVKSGEPLKLKPLLLRAGCTIEATILDDRTGSGLANVDLWISLVPPPGERDERREIAVRSWEVATRISHYDRPLTDKEGKLRAVVEPGKYKFGAPFNHRPPGLFASLMSEVQECTAGKTVSLTFRLKP